MLRVALLCVVASGCDAVFGIAPVPDAGRDATAHHDDAPQDGSDDSLPPVHLCPVSYTLTTAASTTKYRLDTGHQFTWFGAEQACENDHVPGSDLHTHLAVIANEQERAPLVQSGLVLWLGASSVIVPGEFLWVTDEPISGYPPATVGAPPWEASSPNNAGSACIIDDQVNVGGTGWNDRNCTNIMNNFLCECDAFAVDQNHF